MKKEISPIGHIRGSIRTLTSERWLNPKRVDGGVAETTRVWNQPEHLREFIDRTSIFAIDQQGTRIHFTVSDTPMSEKHIMLVMENKEMIERKSWDEGLIIHDQKKEIRDIYWLSALKALDFFTEKINGGGDSVVFTENTSCKVSSSENRLPRSIGLIHSHITCFPKDLINKGYNDEVYLEAVQDEISAWENIADSFIGELNSKTLGKNTPAFSRREHTFPPGYKLEINYNQSAFTTSQKISSILNKHHRVYKESVVNQISNNSRIKPQPSYRTYIEIMRNDKIKISISPILLSHLGSITASGIFTERVYDPNYPIIQRRKHDEEFIREIGYSVYTDLEKNKYDVEILRDKYPY